MSIPGQPGRLRSAAWQLPGRARLTRIGSGAAGLELAGSLPGSPAWVKPHVHGAVRSCVVLYEAIQCCMARRELRSALRRVAPRCRAALHNAAVWCCTVLCGTTHSCVALCSAVWCYTGLCGAVWCWAVLYSVQCYATYSATRCTVL